MEANALSVGIVSLGCDKNRVDTERMAFILQNAGYSITSDAQLADIIIVNTCAFIQAARKEAIDTIFQMSRHKQDRCKKLVVTGCLPKKHPEELFKELTEADAFLGTESYSALPQILEEILLKNNRVLHIKDVDGKDVVHRVQTTPQHYAYLKIAEGCFNACSFCTIPQIRGKYRSRDVQSLVQEAQILADFGVRELILVAQDTTAFGRDRGEKDGLSDLVERLANVQGIEWLRLMYCYPESVSQRLIDLIAHHPRVAKNIDIPLQHAHDDILRAMRRRCSAAEQAALIERIRAANPAVAIRSTFMVGFPTEEQRHFEALLSFLAQYKLEHMGFFAYSREQGTAAYSLKPQISAAVKKERLKIAQKEASIIMAQQRASMVGGVQRVLYEDIDFKKGRFVGRSDFFAPKVDGNILFKGRFADVGSFYSVQITGTKGLDLIGNIIY